MTLEEQIKSLIHGDWKWYAGTTDEIFELGPFKSRDEAIKTMSTHYDSFHVVEAKREGQRLSVHFDVMEYFIEIGDKLDENHSDPNGESGPLSEVLEPEVKALQNMVRNAVDMWQVIVHRPLRGYMFTETRNHEYVRINNADTK